MTVEESETKYTKERNVEREKVEKFKRRLKNKGEKVFLTLEDVASLLQVEYITALRLVRKRKLTAGKVGRQWRVYVEDLYEFFRECCKFQGCG
ncbi:MAG: helix-turn-helix domain-containing protein [Victivallales bacterium]